MTKIERLCTAVSKIDALLVEVAPLDDELRDALRDARARAQRLAHAARRVEDQEVEPWDR
jgi:hypothetical protein